MELQPRNSLGPAPPSALSPLPAPLLRGPIGVPARGHVLAEALGRPRQTLGQPERRRP